jgi:hypothetical protein
MQCKLDHVQEEEEEEEEEEEKVKLRTEGRPKNHLQSCETKENRH